MHALIHTCNGHNLGALSHEDARARFSEHIPISVAAWLEGLTRYITAQSKHAIPHSAPSSNLELKKTIFQQQLKKQKLFSVPE